MAKAEKRLELRKRKKYLVRQGREFPVPHYKDGADGGVRRQS